jgi:ABC-type sugar transport system substrate-binding protein
MMVNGKTYDSFTNSGMDIVTICNVDAMAEAWANNDFTKPLPDWKCQTVNPFAKLLEDATITIAWIPKALGNPVFETGKVGAEAKAKELTEKGPYKVEIVYTASGQLRHRRASRVVEDTISKGVDAIGISCNRPTGCRLRSTRLSKPASRS